MIYYMNICLPQDEHFWRPVPEWFTPGDIHKEHLIIKVGDAVYTNWSEEFESAVIWEKLRGPR